jgi:hypothetical protein
MGVGVKSGSLKINKYICFKLRHQNHKTNLKLPHYEYSIQPDESHRHESSEIH